MTGFPLPPTQLELILADDHNRRTRGNYALHLIWLIGLQLFTLSGGQDYPVPDPIDALSPQDHTSTSDEILASLLNRLQAERSA